MLVVLEITIHFQQDSPNEMHGTRLQNRVVGYIKKTTLCLP